MSDPKPSNWYERIAIAIGRYFGVGGVYYLSVWAFVAAFGDHNGYVVLALWSIIPAALSGVFWLGHYQDATTRFMIKPYAVAACYVWVAMMVFYFLSFFTMGLLLVFAPVLVAVIWRRRKPVKQSAKQDLEIAGVAPSGL